MGDGRRRIGRVVLLVLVALAGAGTALAFAGRRALVEWALLDQLHRQGIDAASRGRVAKK